MAAVVNEGIGLTSREALSKSESISRDVQAGELTAFLWAKLQSAGSFLSNVGTFVRGHMMNSILEWVGASPHV